MRIYNIEIEGNETKKFFLDYDHAEKYLVKLGYVKKFERDEEEGLKASFERQNDLYAVSIGWAEPFSYAAITWIDTQD